ncbi:MAG: carbohydrate-binding protein [Ruminococcus sp.]|nr:carbohydrate-binding protein [Ruminococcus sp.]
MKKYSGRLKGAACAVSAALALSALPFVSSAAVAADADYFLRGDVVDNDGITNKDALAIQKYKLNLSTLDDTQLIAADANADGQVNMADAVAIMQSVLSDRRELHVGEYARFSDGKSGVVGGDKTGALSRFIFDYEAEEEGNYKLRLNTANGYSFDVAGTITGNYGYEYTPFVIKPGVNETIVIVRLEKGKNTIDLSMELPVQIAPASEIYRTVNNPDPTEPIPYDPGTSTTSTTTETSTITSTTTTTSVTTTTTTTTTAPPVQARYYAVEADTHKGWEESTNAGFAGTAYINYDNCIGSYVEWTVEVPEDGNYEADFRYANGSAVNRPVKLIVNGDREYGQYLDFNGTGAWTTWDDVKTTVALKKGKNTIKAYATTSGGGPNIDYLELTNTDGSAPHDKATSGMRVEKLNRGVSAAYTGSGVLVSWRLLATDNEQTTFDLWRITPADVRTKLGTFTMKDASNYFDKDGTAADKYTIDTYVNGECTEFAQFSTNYSTKNSGQSGAYFDINTQTPPGGTTPDGVAYTYTENDCSVGDVDGDGEYEVIVKWDPSNSHDNADAGYTGNVIIDCYKLDSTLLWRIDLGKNIRAGAHYTQFMVYDFDGDGKAEMICKTADGTKDGAGNVIGNGNADYRDSTKMKLRDGSYAPSGRILSGPEYLTLFDGQTGKALDTIDFEPAREEVSSWGDTYGNRCDRFTGCVAYLDGVNPYACFGRGYYERTTMATYKVENKKLKLNWKWDTGTNKSVLGYGDGNHHCMAADVDQDGRQEIVLGSAVLNGDGKVLYSTQMAHGDAIHIGDFDPTNPGLEIFQCLEDENHPNGNSVGFGILLRDAATGRTLFRETAAGDTGRCICDNLITGNGGAEMNGSHSGNVYSCTGDHKTVCAWSDITKWGQNSLVYWTDVLERAVLDRTMADQYGKGRVFTGDGVTYNNYTKSNACLTCDLTGDWREEMIFRKGDGGLRVFTTTFESKYNIYSLMHNPQYRTQIASQNNGYNQPPHTDYYIDTTEYVRPEEPDVWTID